MSYVNRATAARHVLRAYDSLVLAGVLVDSDQIGSLKLLTITAYVTLRESSLEAAFDEDEDEETVEAPF